MSAAAMSDPGIGPVFASFDDVTIRITPVSWIARDMATLDAQAFGGRLERADICCRWIDGDAGAGGLDAFLRMLRNGPMRAHLLWFSSHRRRF
jgi:hypothetical protein